jgi:hypothetical protein
MGFAFLSPRSAASWRPPRGGLAEHSNDPPEPAHVCTFNGRIKGVQLAIDKATVSVDHLVKPEGYHSYRHGTAIARVKSKLQTDGGVLTQRCFADADRV